jgi:hypothetical protein
MIFRGVDPELRAMCGVLAGMKKTSPGFWCQLGQCLHTFAPRRAQCTLLQHGALEHRRRGEWSGEIASEASVWSGPKMLAPRGPRRKRSRVPCP